MGNVASQHYDGTRDSPASTTSFFAEISPPVIRETRERARRRLARARVRQPALHARIAFEPPRPRRSPASRRATSRKHALSPFSGREAFAFRADKARGANRRPLDSETHLFSIRHDHLSNAFVLACAEKYNKDHNIHSRPMDELMNHGEINHEHKMSRTPRTSMDNGRRGSIDESHARRSIDLSTQKSLGGKIYAVDVNVNRDMEDKMVSGLI
jgi:hypothetical protein